MGRWAKTGLLILAAVALAPSCSEPETDAPDAPSPVTLALRTPIDLDFKDAPLADVLAHLRSRQPDLDLTIDPDLAARGMDLSKRRVALSVRQVPVEIVLRVLVRGDLALRVEPSRVTVTARDRLATDLVTVSYRIDDIVDLLGGGQGVAGPASVPPRAGARTREPPYVSELLAIVVRLINHEADPDVAAWDHEGGPAAVEYRAGALVVTQTDRAHERIWEFLGLLRRALRAQADAWNAAAQSSAPLCTREAAAALAQHRRLRERIDVDLASADLRTAIDRIGAARPGLYLICDPYLPKEAAALAGRSLTFKVTGIPLESALALVLPEGLRCVSLRGCFLITGQKYGEELPLVIYPIGDIARSDFADFGFQETIAILQRFVSFNTDSRVAPWSDEGGLATIEYVGGLLFISQTPAAHEHVEAVLHFVRQARQACSALGENPTPALQQTVITYGEPEGCEAVLQRLAGRGRADFARADLDGVLRTLGDAHGLNIVVDPALAEEGTDLKARLVNLRIKDAPLESILRLVLGPDLEYTIGPGYLLIGQRVQHLAMRAYPVADMLACSRLFEDSEDGPQELIAIIQRTVSSLTDSQVAPWSDEGGPACIECTYGTLLMSQTARGHERTLGLLNDLRQALAARPGQEGPPPQAWPRRTPGVQSVRNRLAERVSVDFRDTPLEVALERFAQETGLDIAVAPGVAAGGIDLTARVLNLRLAAAPAALALRLMLGPDLAYEAEDGYVYVVMRDARSLPVITYPAEDLAAAFAPLVWAEDGKPAPLGQFDPAGTLPALIQAAVNGACDPEVAFWADEGGPAACEMLAGTLIVTQTERGLEKTAQVLALVRRAVQARDAQRAADRPAEVQLAIYSPPDPETAAAAEGLKARAAVRFKDTPLERALAVLAHARPGLSIVAEENVSGAKVSFETQGDSVAAILSHMLGEDMAFAAQRGYVAVTSAEKARLWSMVPVFYPVADLLPQPVVRRLPPRDSEEWLIARFRTGSADRRLEEAAQKLVDALLAAVTAETAPGAAQWDDGGSLIRHEGGLLLVVQTPSGHEKVEEFLNQFRHQRLRGRE